MTGLTFGALDPQEDLRRRHPSLHRDRDDGIRVFVDANLVVNGWNYQPPTTYAADVPLPAGHHTVVVEYFEWSGGAQAHYSESRLGE